MQKIIFGVVVWLSLGAYGCVLGIRADLNDGFDLTVTDLCKYMVAVLFGPIALIMAFGNEVLIKGKKSRTVAK